MSRRAPRRRGERPVGLFAWKPGEEVVEDQAPAGDRRNPCPVPDCHAQPLEPCTRGTRRGGRVPLRGVHDSRRTQETQ